jgi:hypothetical protein
MTSGCGLSLPGEVRELNKLEETPQRSLLDVLPVGSRLAELVKALPDRYHEMDESQLIAEAKPTNNDWGLRHYFWKAVWKQIHSVDASSSRICMADIYRDVCSSKAFQITIAKPHKLAFMIKPLRQYQDELDVQTSIAMNRVTQITQLDIANDADWCPKRASVILRAAHMVFERQLGQTIQRSINVNVNSNTADTQKYKTAQDIDQEIATLTAKLGKPAITIDTDKKEDV